MINQKRVSVFLMESTDAEIKYMMNCLQVSSHLKELVASGYIKEDDVCELFSTSKDRVAEMLKGAYNWSLDEISKIEAVRYAQILAHAGEQSKITTFPEYKYSKPITEQ